MSLQGDLKEFGVPEIFQLLEQQNKNGCLVLTIESRPIEIYFREGKIVGVIPDGRTPCDHLLGTLDRLGFLTETEKEKIRDLHGKDLRGLPEILQQHNILEHREMDLLLTEQIKETLFPAFTCRNGRFSFEQDKMLSSEWSLRNPLAVEPMILEGLRQTDEWPMIKGRIGSFQEVPQRQFIPKEKDPATWKDRILAPFRRTPGASGEGGPDRERFPDEDASLSSAEKIVYNLIDGKRNVEEIERSCSLGDYSTCKALLDLWDRGWIRIDRTVEKRGGAQSTPGKGGLGKWLFGAVGLLLLFLGVSLLNHSVKNTWLIGQTGQGGAPLFRMLNQHQRARVVRAVEIYQEEHGNVPARLSDLVRTRLLTPGDLVLWGDSLFSYSAENPETYRLLIVPAP
jgi:hypothetical protein